MAESSISGAIDMRNLYPFPANRTLVYRQYRADGSAIASDENGDHLGRVRHESWGDGSTFTQQVWYDLPNPRCPDNLTTDIYRWGADGNLYYLDTYNWGQSPPWHVSLRGPGNLWADGTMTVNAPAVSTPETIHSFSMTLSSPSSCGIGSETSQGTFNATVYRQLVAVREWSPYTDGIAGGPQTRIDALLLGNTTIYGSTVYEEKMTFAWDHVRWVQIRTQGFVNGQFGWDMRMERLD